jgi:hypothetical protein
LATNARKVGTAAEPDTGPINPKFAVCVENAPVSVPDVVTGEPDIVNTDVGNASATEVTVPVPAGKSADVNARNVGVAALPEAGPANTKFADSVFNVSPKVPLVVIGDPDTENIEGTVIPTEVTVPLVPGVICEVTVVEEL